MPDWFEFVYGFDSSNPDDAFGDADGDGLTNLREYSPEASDTDGDGMTDGYEVQHGLDPTGLQYKPEGCHDRTANTGRDGCKPCRKQCRCRQKTEKQNSKMC